MSNKEPLFFLEGIESTKIVISPAHEQVKAKALKEAQSVKIVSDGFSAEIAADVLRSLKTLSRSLEASRQEVKAPVLALSRKIDDTAKSFVGDLATESNRISRILGAWQQAEREKAARARKEAEEKERQARFEAQRKALEARTAIEEDEAKREGAEKVREARIEKANTRQEEPKGTYVKTTLKYEITDIEALFKARPECCRLEPNGDVIRALIKHNKNIEGLKVWEDVQTVVRT